MAADDRDEWDWETAPPILSDRELLTYAKEMREVHHKSPDRVFSIMKSACPGVPLERLRLIVTAAYTGQPLPEPKRLTSADLLEDVVDDVDGMSPEDVVRSLIRLGKSEMDDVVHTQVNRNLRAMVDEAMAPTIERLREAAEAAIELRVQDTLRSVFRDAKVDSMESLIWQTVERKVNGVLGNRAALNDLIDKALQQKIASMIAERMDIRVMLNSQEPKKRALDLGPDRGDDLDLGLDALDAE